MTEVRMLSDIQLLITVALHLFRLNDARNDRSTDAERHTTVGYCRLALFRLNDARNDRSTDAERHTTVGYCRLALI